MSPHEWALAVANQERVAELRALRWRWLKVAAAVVLAVAVVAGVRAWEREVQAGAAAQVEIARLARERDALRVQSARADTVWVRDTVRVARTITRYRDARARADSALAADSIEVPAVVDSALVAADNAVSACEAAQASATAVVTTCRAELAKADSVIAVQGKEIKRLRPSRFRRFLSGAGRVVTHAGAFVGGALLAGKIAR